MRWITAVAVVFGLLAGPAGAAEVERVDLVTHVFPETGHRVVAVQVRYDGPASPRSHRALGHGDDDGVTGPRHRHPASPAGRTTAPRSSSRSTPPTRTRV